MITIMIVFMNGRAGGRLALESPRVDECTNAFGWRSGLRLWACMPRSIGILDSGFGTRDDGVKILVYILWVRIRYSISMNLFDIGN
jgi:hypothetical protein